MIRKLITTAAAALALAGTLAGAPAAQAAPTTHYDATRTACTFSDGPGPCFYDAAKRGNHHGSSYWIDRKGFTHYVDGVSYRLQSYAGEPTGPAQYDATRVPCATEDGGAVLPCFWDAGKRGNHRGASYWIGVHGWAHYVDGTTFHLAGVGE